MAISAGIGLFLGIIALKDAGIVVSSPETLVTLGTLGAPAALLAGAGFVLMVALDRLGVPGALIIGGARRRRGRDRARGLAVFRSRLGAAEPCADLSRRWI